MAAISFPRCLSLLCLMGSAQLRADADSIFHMIGKGINHVESAAKAMEKKQPDYNPYEQIHSREVRNYAISVMERLRKRGGLGLMEIYVSDMDLVQASTFVAAKNIFVTKGMLGMLANEAELACLIGHEMGHIQADPDYSKMDMPGDDVLDQLHLKSLAVWDARQEGGKFWMAKFHQDQEEAADRFGAELAQSAGYDPFAFVELFQRLSAKVNKDLVYRINKVHGTHRALDERAGRLRKFLLEKGYVEGAGFRRTEAFASGVDPLWRDVPAAGASDVAEVKEIRERIGRDSKAGRRIELSEFLKTMDRLGEICRRNRVSRKMLVCIGNDSAISALHFMEEVIYLDMGNPTVKSEDSARNLVADAASAAIEDLVMESPLTVQVHLSSCRAIALVEGIRGFSFPDMKALTRAERLQALTMASDIGSEPWRRIDKAIREAVWSKGSGFAEGEAKEIEMALDELAKRMAKLP